MPSNTMMNIRDLAAILLIFAVTTPSPAAAQAGDLDPCASGAWLSGAPAGILICPTGDGDALYYDLGRLTVRLLDIAGAPMAGVLASDIWLTGCDRTFCPCQTTHYASAPTNAAGETTIDLDALRIGGSASGFSIIAMGRYLLEADCSARLCVTVNIASPDFNKDLAIDLTDIALFAEGYFASRITFDPRCDFNHDGVVDIIDLAKFSEHFGHGCISFIPCL